MLDISKKRDIIISKKFFMRMGMIGAKTQYIRNKSCQSII